MCYVVWFPYEAKYSLVDGKNATIVQPNPKVKDDVVVKGSSKGQKWNASVVFIGKYMIVSFMFAGFVAFLLYCTPGWSYKRV